MKTNVTCSVDADLLAEAKRGSWNVSLILNDALKGKNSSQVLTPDEKAAAGMANAKAVIELQQKQDNLTLLHKEIAEKKALMTPLLPFEENLQIWRDSKIQFPKGSMFSNDEAILTFHLKRINYFLEKVSPKPPSKKAVKKDG